MNVTPPISLPFLIYPLSNKGQINPHIVFQPAFKALSQLWIGLQDEVELLNILNNIRLNLQPFTASQAKLFSEAYLDGLLGTSEVKTDEQRMVESSGMADVTNTYGMPACKVLNCS